MAGEWKTLRVSELLREGVLFVEDGNHGEYRPLADEFQEDGTPFVRPDDLIGGRVHFANCDRINDRALDRVRKGKGRAGDIVFTHRATVGRIARTGSDAPDFVANPGVTVWRSTAPNVLDPVYLYFFMQTPTFMNQVWAEAGSTDTFPYVSLTQQRGLTITFPSIEQQRQVAHILGTLDDKIELNRRMIETLEAMARALFKSWFVDFDPVRAKAEGREPGLPQPLADVLPDSFEDSELGEIPRGWEVGSIHRIADVIYGAPFASSQFNTEGLGEPLIRIRDLGNESPGVWTPEVHPKGYKVRLGDVVVGMDGEFRAYLWGGAEAWLNQRVCVFVPKGTASAAFVRNSIVEPLAHIEATETATTVIHLGKGDIDRFLVVLPTDKVLAAFNENCQPWYQRIVAAKQESRTLAALRDTLLPKLISGERQVQDAEQFTESVSA